MKSFTRIPLAVSTLLIALTSAAQVPPNDLCENVTPDALTPGGTLIWTGDNTGATDTEGLGVPSVWHAFTTTEFTNITISYCGTAGPFQNVIPRLWIGCPWTNEFFTWADYNACGDGNATMPFGLVVPGTYYYAVSAGVGSTGEYQITVTADILPPQPANDLCTAVTPDALDAGGSLSWTGDNTGALDSEGFWYTSVWHAFTTTECTSVTISYCGMAVPFPYVSNGLYNSCPITAGHYGNSNFDECGDGNATIHFDVAAGTYYFPVFGGPDATGAYAITVTAVACAPAPVNDLCDSATPDALAVGGNVTWTGDNTGALNTEGLWAGPSVWHAFTTTECSMVSISYCGMAAPFLAVGTSLFDDCSGAEHYPYGYLDVDACGDGNATVFFEFLSPGTYYYAVIGGADATGAYDITVTAEACPPPPANDLCDAVTPDELAIGGSVTWTGDNTGAQDTELFGIASAWEAFTTTECANLTFSYCAMDVPFAEVGPFWLFIECPWMWFNPQSAVDYGLCGDGNLTVTFNAVTPGTYYYPIWRGAGATGPYEILVTVEPCDPPPANDACANAQALNVYTTCTPTDGSSWGGDESMPSTPCGGFQANNAIDVWYSFVATGTEHTVSVTGTDGMIPYIEMFSGMCDNSTSLGCVTAGPFGSDPLEMVESGLTVGETYFLRVYGNFGAGTFNICVTGDIATSAFDAGIASVPFSVFPNPSNGDMTIRFGAADSKVVIELFDMAGRAVHQEQRQLFNGQQVDLGLAGKLAPGVYTLRLTTSRGRSEQRVAVN